MEQVVGAGIPQNPAAGLLVGYVEAVKADLPSEMGDIVIGFIGEGRAADTVSVSE